MVVDQSCGSWLQKAEFACSLVFCAMAEMFLEKSNTAMVLV
jgi:hypothetical protein